MFLHFRKSLVFGTTVGVVGVALLIGLLFKLVAADFSSERAERNVTTHLDQLVDTIESTASVACFAKDAQLAKELVNGVIKNIEVARVTITADGVPLAKAERPAASTRGSGLITTLPTLKRTLMSPFDATKAVGEISLEPNYQHMEHAITEQVRFVGLLLAVQLVVIAVAVMGVVFWVVVRPIKAMSDRLHRMNATAGEQLAIPARHENNEIGRLALDINGLANKLVLALRDEHQLRLQREMEERKYRGIFENADSGIFIVDRSGRLTSWNHSFSRLTALPTDAAKAPPLWELPWREPDMITTLIDSCLVDDSTREDDFELLLGAEASCWLHIAASPIGPETVQGIVSDVTTRKRAETSAREMAVTDPLTGLGNRPALEQHLLESIRAEEPFALMIADLDGFKRINDAMGFPIGDQILVIAATRLQDCLKHSDWLARAGSDEFAIILPGIGTVEAASRIGERVLDALGRPYDIPDAPALLGASIGISLYPRDGGDLPTLLRNSELAVDRARAAGGRNCQFFDAQMVEAAAQRRRLEADLRHAIVRNEFRLYYQPIIDLASHRMIGAEALIRWQHPQRGLVPPDEFIPLAEETGFVIELGLWVVEEACRQLALWRADGLDLYLSLNVSARQIPDSLPLSLLLDISGRHGIPPSALALEITEGVLMADATQGIAWLSAVRSVGFRTYLDDFGTGYSSLSYLKRFPMNVVKIDKSFVRDMGEDSSDRALVSAIIAMTRSLGLAVVAEGVETTAQLGLLRGMGCNYGQGYYFSRPLPAAEIPAARARIDAAG